MSDRKACVGPEEVGVLMDLLSHDILNNNQATLSYLELIHSSEVDRRTKEFAEKAASQLRTSSVLLDGVRRFVSSSRGGRIPTSPVDLRETLADVGREVSSLFPHKKVTVDLSGVAAGTRVIGANCVSDLFTNLIMNLVQLDPAQRVRVEVKVRPARRKAGTEVRVEVSSPNAVLPQGVGDDLFAHASPGDTSKMARVSGAVFASSVARALGGGVTSRVLDPKRNRGCAFEVTLEGVRPR